MLYDSLHMRRRNRNHQSIGEELKSLHYTDGTNCDAWMGTGEPCSPCELGIRCDSCGKTFAPGRPQLARVRKEPPKPTNHPIPQTKAAQMAEITVTNMLLQTIADHLSDIRECAWRMEDTLTDTRHKLEEIDANTIVISADLEDVKDAIAK